MNYEIVTLPEKIAVGISARTNNQAPDMSTVIDGLWTRFFNEGVYTSIPDKVNEKALGIYTDYENAGKSDYTVMAACEVSSTPAEGGCDICKIPAGKYASRSEICTKPSPKLGRKSGSWICQGRFNVILKNIKMTICKTQKSIFILA